MEEFLDRIVDNARAGTGPCAGCPAQRDTNGRLVNPGLIDPNADLMFLTMDPSHYTDWETYADWAEYNAAKTEMFIERAPGGKAISKLLDGIPGATIEEIWLADAVKCPANNDRAGEVDADAAFEHCSAYLTEEIQLVDPTVIVTMGNDPAEQLLTGVFDRATGTIHAGTTDAGRVFETTPPVVVSPHWANGWLGRHDNREKVRKAIRQLV